jgi:hypothetical protein
MTDHDGNEDTQLLVAYVLDELDDAARWRLEQRLAVEPALAEQLVGLETLDLVGATLAATRPVTVGQAGRAHRAHRPRVLLLMLAVAAALLVAWLWPARKVACEVRAVATAGGDVVGYATALDLPAQFRRPLEGQRGVGTTEPPVAVADFLAAAAAREQERSDDALAAAPGRVASAFFTLRFRVDRDCSGLVLQLDAAGGLHRRYPARPEVRPFGEVDNRFAAGRIHVLPRPVAVANTLGSVSLYPGFDVPSDVPLRRTWLLLAVRSEPIGPALLDDVDGLVARALPALEKLTALSPTEQEAAVDRRLQPVLGWLHEQGFTTQRITVDGE